jgi:predicted adenylyl cyclase CyaB
MHINFEFKAITNKLEKLEEKLKTLNPIFIGIDHQIDTYFNTQIGRLKLREGNIENSLIHYNRPDIADAKQSDVLLYTSDDSKILKEILIKSNGVRVVVDKQRKIYFIDNVKFHFDTVESLGTFVEVEAIDKDCNLGIEKLQEQCKFYAALFDIKQEDYIHCSYSDLIIAKANY